MSGVHSNPSLVSLVDGREKGRTWNLGGNRGQQVGIRVQEVGVAGREVESSASGKMLRQPQDHRQLVIAPWKQRQGAQFGVDINTCNWSLQIGWRRRRPVGGRVGTREAYAQRNEPSALGPGAASSLDGGWYQIPAQPGK